MARKIICKLAFKEAIEIIKDENEVFYKHGVWNKYEKASTEYVIKRIENSGYGADVFEEDGELYVSIPSNSDMW